jgi:hypothetical protein
MNKGNSNTYTIASSTTCGTNSYVVLSMVNEDCVGNTTSTNATIYSPNLIIKGSTLMVKHGILPMNLQPPIYMVVQLKCKVEIPLVWEIMEQDMLIVLGGFNFNSGAWK